MTTVASRCFVFDPFRLDVTDERLWRRDTSVPLGRRAFAVLQCLVSRPGQLVTKEDLLTTVWPDTAVSEAVLTTAMRELRRALGDEARTPTFIQTVHGRGYRFVAPVAETSAPPPARPQVERAFRLVGRDVERRRLHDWFAAVQQGTRRVGLVAGEAGIGKTALIEAFVGDVVAAGDARVATGQCIEHYGTGEAYRPILEALGRLGRKGPVPLADLLRRHAPSWLAHLPSLAPPDELGPSGRVAPERMLRELAEALEIFTAQLPLILVLEDLQWSDTATLEWLALIARRRDPARLLVVGTYRPVDALIHQHPLRDVLAELRHQTQCEEILLDYLQADSVAAYIRQRCGGFPRLAELAEGLHRRTGGLPLFLSTIVDELLRQRTPGDQDLPAIARLIPTSVRQFIEHRFERLSDEDQTIVEAASVMGDPFTVAAIASALAGSSLTEERIEARCAAWTREGRFLLADGTASWPDGTRTARYRFRHALFQEVALARISPERRARFHERIGNRLEGAYGKRASLVASELAVHFEQGGDAGRAVSYLEHAAGNALQRSAYAEAHRHLTHALELLDGLPGSRARIRREASVWLLLAQVAETTKGWSAGEAERAYARARELCRKLGDQSRLIKATWGLIVVSLVRAELHQTRTLAREMLRLAKKRRNRVFQMAAHMELGGTALLLARPTEARSHFDQANALYEPRLHRSYVSAFGADLGLLSRIWATHRLWQDGFPERARAGAEEALRLARALSHPFSEVITLAYAAMLHQFRRDAEEVERLCEATIAHSTEHGFSYYLAWAEVLRGWSRVTRSPASGQDVSDMRRAIDVLGESAGVRLPYYRGLLAEVYGRIGRVDDGLEALAAAFADVRRTDERWWESELHRLRGELLRLAAPDSRLTADAAACFHAAVDIARHQRAPSLELRAATSLARLLHAQGQPREGRRLLAKVYARFTEGFDTADLREARMLLEPAPIGAARRTPAKRAP
jgi:DNA-binding winged helix-turn-helix (wHTH) protein/predicted ATPase